MSGKLTEQQIDQYRREGYLCPLPALSAAEATTARGALEAAQAAGGPIAHTHFYKPHLLYPFLLGLATHPAILDAVESLLGPDILIWGTSLFIKEEASAEEVLWHQDGLHYGLEPADLVSAWLALSESDQGNGCVRVIPGSHTAGMMLHEDLDTHPGTLFRGSRIPGIDDSQAKDLVLRPGEISLHHLHSVHGSNANPSGRRRVGFGLRFIPPHVRQATDREDSALLVRGQDRYGHFLEEQAPLSEDDPATQKCYKEAMRRRETLIFSATAHFEAPEEPAHTGDTP